jgi:hypothetical protein
LRRVLDAGESVDTLYPTFVQSWRRILGGIEEFRRERGLLDKPVLFTEIGYTTRAGSTIEPWAGDGFGLVGDDEKKDLVVWEDQPYAPRERALAMRALREASRESNPRLLAGLLYWKLSTQPEHRDIEPFLLLLGGQPQDPLLAELRAFVAPGP